MVLHEDFAEMVKCVGQNYLAALPSIGKCGEEAAVGFPILVESSTNPITSAETLACIERWLGANPALVSASFSLFVVYLKYTDRVRHLAKGTISTYPHVLNRVVTDLFCPTAGQFLSPVGIPISR